MKLQNYAVIFIVIIMPIAMVLAIYTGNLIDVVNTQAAYDSMLLNSTYDAVRAYQINTLNNEYESDRVSKERDITASVNSFFNSLSSGLSSSGYSKNEISDYIPSLLYTLYDGYYVYGTYDNAAQMEKNKGNDGLTFSSSVDTRTSEYGLMPYLYYSCEYQKDNEYDLVINYTLDNYITVTGTYMKSGTECLVSLSGYYINADKTVTDEHQKTVTLYKGEGSPREITLSPETLGEYQVVIDTVKDPSDQNKVNKERQQREYYNYILYNNQKYYYDTYNNPEKSTSYDGSRIFTLANSVRTYITPAKQAELEKYTGLGNFSNPDGSINGAGFRDVNEYYYYYQALKFSEDVYPIISMIDLGKDGKDIASNAYFDDEGKLSPNNVIKSNTYHVKYVTANGAETHVKTNYEVSNVFDYKQKDNDPSLDYSSFNQHRMDVIISCIESSLMSSIANFNAYTSGTYEYTMPVLTESEWDRICNNLTVLSFMQGLSIKNYKYYTGYALVANTKIKDYISKDMIYIQSNDNPYDVVDRNNSYNSNIKEKEYNNPRCTNYNKSATGSLVGYLNIDYERQSTAKPGDTNNIEYYYMQTGTGAYDCIVSPDSNGYTTDDLLTGQPTSGTLNQEVRRAYITALARARGSAFNTYGYLNNELQVKNTAAQGTVAYTVRYYYQKYDNENNKPIDGAYEQDKERTTEYIEVRGKKVSDINLGLLTNKTVGYKPGQIHKISINQEDKGNDSSTRITGNINEIEIYYDIDYVPGVTPGTYPVPGTGTVQIGQYKTLNYTLEQYKWNISNGKYDKVSSTKYEEKKWINGDDQIDVIIPKTLSDTSYKLIQVDPEIPPTNKVSTGTVIKAYYTNNAELTEQSYTVRYNGNGSSSGSMDNSTYRFYETANLSENKFSKTGYTFKGWALESTSSTVKYPDKEAITWAETKENIGVGPYKESDGKYYLDLYAVWNKITYEVQYLPNGATSGSMSNSTHEYDVAKNLNENQYKQEYTVTINTGSGSLNYYTGNLSSWGSASSVTYDKDKMEYTLNIQSNASAGNGIYYTNTDAVIPNGQYATISYNIYSDKQLTMELSVQNAKVGNGVTGDRVDNYNGEIQNQIVPANTWTTIYYTYQNNSGSDIYDYSVLTPLGSDSKTIKIQNAKCEITNMQTRPSGLYEMASIASTFIGWKNQSNGNEYSDQQSVNNLTDGNNDTVMLDAQWKYGTVTIPKIIYNGYQFTGWTLSDGKNTRNVSVGETISVDRNITITANAIDNIAPITTLTVKNTTTNSILVETKTEDYGSGLEGALHYIYYIRPYGSTGDYTEFDGGGSPTYTFENLKQDTKYDMKVVVESDRDGNKGIGTTTGTTLKLTGNIYVYSQKWYKLTDSNGNPIMQGNDINDIGKQEIKFSYSTNAPNAYVECRKESESTWTKGTTVNNVEHGETVIARITDGINVLDECSAKAWDNINPVIIIESATAKADRPNTINIKYSSYDLECGLGVRPAHKIYYRKITDSNYTTATEGTFGGDWTINNLEYSTTYEIVIKVADRAGNVGTSTIRVTTTYKYTVKFDGNGATSGQMNDEIYTFNIPEVLPANKYSRIGYHYTGYWKLNTNNKLYANNATIFNLANAPGTVILYAQWIDDIKPTMIDIGLNTTAMVSPNTGVVITASSQDLGTGIVAYQFSTADNLNRYSPGWQTISATNAVVTKQYKANSNDTYYFYTLDGAGNYNCSSIVVSNIIPEKVVYPPNNPGKPYYEWEATATGNYRVTLNGGGGPGNIFVTRWTGSKGGLVTLNIYAEKGAKLYVVVGDKGNQIPSDNYWQPATGGYNGGGNGGLSVQVYRNLVNVYEYKQSMKAGNGGGGATTISTKLERKRINNKLQEYNLCSRIYAGSCRRWRRKL